MEMLKIIGQACLITFVVVLIALFVAILIGFGVAAIVKMQTI